METNNTWNNIENQIENSNGKSPIVHRDPGIETLFFRAVASGDIDTVTENCKQKVFGNNEGWGHLSDDPITNLKYHFVVTTALITRFCSEGGMPLEEAYGLSDAYIQKMDHCVSESEILKLHDQMALDYASRMRSLKKYATVTKQVSEAIDYIYSHIRERITINDLADAICISPTYLSRIFKKETGLSVSEFIRQQKIELAKNLLRFSDYNLVDIAFILSYSSQSHFIQHFHSQVGMTPKAYRDTNHKSVWNVNRNVPDET